MTLEELKKLIADDEGETPVCDSNPRNLRIAHCCISASYSGLQTLGFAFAKGKQRLVVSG
jgi:hypothetical protein